MNILTKNLMTGRTELKDPAFRNWVINGNMEVAQRGTSFTNPANGTYTIDRIKTTTVADSGTLPTNIIHSQEKITPGELLKSGFFYRIDCDGTGSSLGANSRHSLFSYIENGTRLLCGLNKKVTKSFMARSSISGKKIGIALSQTYGTGGSPSSSEIITGTNWTLTSDWTLYSYTFTTNTLTGKTFGTNNDDTLIPLFYFQWGSNYTSYVGADSVESYGDGTIDIAQAALYAGDVAYPFEPVPFDVELQRCMRCYEKSWNYASIPGSSSIDGCEYKSVYNGWYLSDSMIRFKVPKRITNCNIVLYSPQDGSSACGAEYNSGGTYVANRSLGKTAYINNFFVYGGDGSFTSGNQIRFQWVADADF